MSSTSPSSAAAGGGADASATTARSQSLAAATGSSPGSRQRKTLHERQGSKESTDSNVLPPPPPDDSPMALKKQNAQLREEVKRLKESMSSLVSNVDLFLFKVSIPVTIPLLVSIAMYSINSLQVSSAEAEEEYITNKVSCEEAYNVAIGVVTMSPSVTLLRTAYEKIKHTQTREGKTSAGG